MTQAAPNDPALEAQYNVRAARADYESLAADWQRRSAALRASTPAVLDIAYGTGARQRLDIFTATPDGPTLVYLHGGYWQRGDKSAYSFLAEAFVARGVNVVTMNYTLCPQTTVPGITGEIRQGLEWLYRNSRAYGLDAQRINVSGHSAGGHLTAMMLATPWAQTASGLPPDLVKAGIAVSGLYELAPLRQTSINHAAGIDAPAARDASPLSCQPPAGARALLVVGGAETAAFHQQAERLAQAWSAAGARIERYDEPGVDHFDVVKRLADPGSGLFARTLAWLV